MTNICIWEGFGRDKGASLVAQMVKNLPAVQEMQVWSLGREDPLEKEMATHLSILAWKKSHGQRSLAGYSPWGHKELDTTESDMTDWGTVARLSEPVLAERERHSSAPADCCHVGLLARGCQTFWMWNIQLSDHARANKTCLGAESDLWISSFDHRPHV